MNKNSIKQYLIISFVVVELLSMIFNFYFIKINVGKITYSFNFSVVFFCLGFFIVDVIADNFSPREANQFISYKIFSQLLFIFLGSIAIKVYSLEQSQLADIIHKSPIALIAGICSTFAGFHLMNSIMGYFKQGIYQGTSIFKRYLCSSLPGELLFSFVFTFLCFFTYKSSEEMFDIFFTSALAKIVLSIMFALIMSLIIKIKIFISQSTILESN